MSSSDKLLAEWFWIDRWVGSSAFGLPIDARGLYREMLTQAWRRGAQLPNDHEQIRRLTGVTEREWRRCWPLVERFWVVDGSTLLNETQVIVYADAQRRSENARMKGVKGAQARAQALAQALAQVSAQAKPEQKPLSLSLKDQIPPIAPLRGGRRPNRNERKLAADVVRNRFGVAGCPHDPKCSSTAACVERTAYEIHAKARAS